MSMNRARVLTESLGGSALTRAACTGGLRDWYRLMPSGPDGWRAYATEVRASVAADWLEALRSAFDARGIAAERLRAAAERGFVVTTGQQPGLFGGPLMTFNKALSARALADTLQRELGMPVAPVFWAATDDADFDEAAHVWVSLSGGAVDLRLSRGAPPGMPMSAVPMRGDVDALLARLAEACGSFATAPLLSTMRQIYRRGETIGNTYVAFLRSVLEPLGVAVLDASDPAVRMSGAAALSRAARDAQLIERTLEERSSAIRARGFTPQVEDVAGLSLVFSNEGGTKRRVPIEAAAHLSAAEQRRLAPTVLLRPLLERSILPTAAYVGGPGEIAYFAQVSAVADCMGVPRPLVVPRWSAIIMEPRIQRQLDALGASLEEIRQPHVAERRLARELIPDAAQSGIRVLREHLEADVAALAASNDALVPAAVLEGYRRSVLHRIERLERRLLAGTKRRATDTMRRLATVTGALHPDGARQERKLSFVPFIVRYGEDLVGEMLEHAAVHARGLVAGAASARTADPAVAQPT